MAVGSTKMGAGIVTTLPVQMSLSSVIIGIIIGAGLAAVVLQWIFYESLPALILFTIPLTAVVDFFFTGYMELFADEVIVMIKKAL